MLKLEIDSMLLNNRRSYYSLNYRILTFFYIYKTLDKNFITEYAKFWLSILDRDQKKMKLHSKNLGVEGDGMYGLFACMVTGRSWNMIVNGIEK